MIKHTVDMVALTVLEGTIHILLIERAKEPFRGRYALPGGHLEPGEDLLEGALRELREETGLSGPILTAQVGTFGHPKRDPRGHVISTAFLGIFEGLPKVKGAGDAKAALWFPLEVLPHLAFDHSNIIKLARTKICTGGWTGKDRPTETLRLHPDVLLAEQLLRG